MYRILKYPVLLLFLIAFAAYAAIALKAPGAGLDPDAWRIALAGLRWQQSGVYQPSRPPGFPVVEALAALTSPLGLSVFKLLTAAAAAYCVSLTYSLAAAYSKRVALLAAFLLACCPAFVIAASSTMDYIWALAFSLLALRMSQKGRPCIAGLLIGLACGCRITAIAILPVSWLMVPDQARSRQAALLTTAIAALVAAILFTAVRWAHPSIVAESQNRVFMPPLTVLWDAPIALFGRVGAICLLVCGLLCLLPRSILNWKRLVSAPNDNDTHTPRARSYPAPLLMVVVCIAAFIPAAYEPAYLLPALPALFILLAARLPTPATCALCTCLLVMNYRDYSSGGLTYGAVAQDLRDRRVQARIADAFLTSPPPPPALVIAGSRAPVFLFRIATDGRPFPPQIEIDHLLRRSDVTGRLQPDQSLYCLHDMLPPCRARGFDPLEMGAILWRPPPREPPS